MIIAFDPGDTTGVVIFSEDCIVMWTAQLSLDELIDWLDMYDPTVQGIVTHVIVEDYVLFAKRAVRQSGSRMKASQGIGAIKLFARKRNAKVVMQPASILPIAQKFSGVTMPSNHAQSHWVSAFLHGYYWFVQEGRTKTALQLSKESAPKE